MKWLAMMLVALSVFAVAATDTPQWEVRDDFATILADAGAVGTIVVLDEQAKRWYVTNRDRAEEALPPASTFKIFNAMAALDEHVVAGPHEVIAWDGVERDFPQWNRDHDLDTGMKASAVWFYQELARRIGEPKMRLWLDRVEYGNRNASGGIDQFWLNGKLRISARDQVLFLRRLADEELPFSKESQRTVTQLIEVAPDPEVGEGTVLRGKTGMLSPGTPGAVGWYVGWAERDGRRWFFAVNIDLTDKKLLPARTAIVKRALTAVGAIPS